MTELYPYSAKEALKRDELELWRKSHYENQDCKNAIEDIIRQNFDGMHLKHDCIYPIVEKYGWERTELVLAVTLREMDWDGRFSRANKEWAKNVDVPEDGSHNIALIVRSHPAVLDGYIQLFRAAQNQEIQSGMTME